MTTKKDEFLTQVKQQLRLCAGFEGDDVSKAREDSLNYYFQRARGDEVPGRSAVVSGDLSAMVEANLAAMNEAFAHERIAEFDATGPEDEDQAQLESDVVQHLVMKKSNGKLQILQAIKDALLLRNGVIKVAVIEKTTVITRTIQNVAPEAAALIEEQVDSMKYDVKKQEAITRTRLNTREFKCEAVPLENFLYTANWDKLDLQDIPFAGERHISTRSELIELFPAEKKVINELPKMSMDYSSTGNIRNPKQMSQFRDGIDASQDPIEWFECYVLADRDEDGISERRKVCIHTSAILEDTAVNLVPYAAGTAIINPHRFLGISLFDKLKQVQDLNTGLQRALMDNVNTTNKNRVAYKDGRVNVDDISDGRPNGGIRVNANEMDVRAAVSPFQIPDTSANILANIEYQNRVRSELGGAALDMQSAQLQIGGDGMGSQGLDRAYSVAEQLAAYFTQTLAMTLLRSTFLLSHATLREYYDQPMQIKLNGRWATAVPSEWPSRDGVTIKPGMSPGEKQRRSQALLTILRSQVDFSNQGLDDVLVNIDGFYNTLMDWARNENVQNPEQYFVDPRTDESKQAAQGKQEQQQKIELLNKELVRNSLDMEKLRIALDKYTSDADRQFKYYDAVLKSEIEEAKIAGQATVDFINAKQQSKLANQQKEVRSNGSDTTEGGPTT